VVILSVKKTPPPPPPHHHPGYHYNLGGSGQPMKLIFGIQPYSKPTTRNMEDDLNILENGRRPQFF
jgi:hypothetical protein